MNEPRRSARIAAIQSIHSPCRAPPESRSKHNKKRQESYRSPSRQSEPKRSKYKTSTTLAAPSSPYPARSPYAESGRNNSPPRIQRHGDLQQSRRLTRREESDEDDQDEEDETDSMYVSTTRRYDPRRPTRKEPRSDRPSYDEEEQVSRRDEKDCKRSPKRKYSSDNRFESQSDRRGNVEQRSEIQHPIKREKKNLDCEELIRPHYRTETQRPIKRGRRDDEESQSDEETLMKRVKKQRIIQIPMSARAASAAHSRKPPDREESGEEEDNNEEQKDDEEEDEESTENALPLPTPGQYNTRSRTIPSSSLPTPSPTPSRGPSNRRSHYPNEDDFYQHPLSDIVTEREKREGANDQSTTTNYPSMVEEEHVPMMNLDSIRVAKVIAYLQGWVSKVQFDYSDGSTASWGRIEENQEVEIKKFQMSDKEYILEVRGHSRENDNQYICGSITFQLSNGRRLKWKGTSSASTADVRSSQRFHFCTKGPVLGLDYRNIAPKKWKLRGVFDSIQHFPRQPPVPQIKKETDAHSARTVNAVPKRGPSTRLSTPRTPKDPISARSVPPSARTKGASTPKPTIKMEPVSPANVQIPPEIPTQTESPSSPKAPAPKKKTARAKRKVKTATISESQLGTEETNTTPTSAVISPFSRQSFVKEQPPQQDSNQKVPPFPPEPQSSNWDPFEDPCNRKEDDAPKVAKLIKVTWETYRKKRYAEDRLPFLV